MLRMNRRRASICTMALSRLATRRDPSSCPCRRGREPASGVSPHKSLAPALPLYDPAGKGPWLLFQSIRSPDANFVEMVQHVARILVYAICPGLFELLLAVAARQEPDAKRTRPLGGKQVP